MTGPGIFSYSTTPADNVQANTGINWDEGMPPAAVNNSARQNMTDTRNAFNDLIWFKYGKGDLDYSPVYASGTTFTVSGGDYRTPYHIGRRVKAVGSSTGTIYGTITNSTFSTDTTVTVAWDSGSLSNESLTIYLSQAPVTGSAISANSVKGSPTNDSATAGNIGEIISSSVTAASSISLVSTIAKTITSISLTAGDWDVSAVGGFVGVSNTNVGYSTASISTSDNTNATIGTSARVQFGAQGTPFSTDTVQAFAVGPHRISISSTTTIYLVEAASFTVNDLAGFGTIRARRVR